MRFNQLLFTPRRRRRRSAKIVPGSRGSIEWHWFILFFIQNDWNLWAFYILLESILEEILNASLCIITPQNDPKSPKLNFSGSWACHILLESISE